MRRRHVRRAASALLLVGVGLTACNEEELEVAYLTVPSVAVAPAGRPEADAIAAVRLVVDSLSLGFYPVPAEVPVLALGPRRVRLEPAVRRSGLGGEVVVYPLYEALTRELDLRASGVDTLRPIFGYVPGAVIGLEEGFESAATQFSRDLSPGGSAPLAMTTADPRDGTAAGLITLTPEAPVYEVASAVIRPGRASLLDLWVELDYRGEGILAVALLPEDAGPAPAGTPPSARYSQGALPRETWTRFYFDIVDASNRDFVAEGFRVSLLAIYDAGLGARQELFVDNLRVVYR